MAAPVSPGIGDFIDKPFWDAEIYNRNVDLQAAWTNWKPSWTAVTSNPSLGNGTLVAAYKQVGYGGATVHVRMRLRAGSTTTFGSGLWSFTLPSALVPIAVQTLHGFAGSDTGIERHTVAAYITTSGLMDRISSAGGTGLSNTSPFVWANGYQLIIGGTYQIS
jgi:hypothetical protein